MKNFIPINRKIFEHYLWKEKRVYSKFEAWFDLLRMVSFKDGNKNMVNGKLCEWVRGQFPVSISFLSKRWMWGDKQVRNYLKLLEKENMIELERASKWTMLTICKYEDYNKLGQSQGKSEGNHRAITGQQLKILNTINKDKKDALHYWLDYRKEIKKPIKANKTLQTLIKTFNNTELDRVREVVMYSINGSYVGLFWKDAPKGVRKKTNEKETAEEVLERINKEAREKL